MFKNHQNCLNWFFSFEIFEFSHQSFQKNSNVDFSARLNENVASFARNIVKWDFFSEFYTLWLQRRKVYFHAKLSRGYSNACSMYWILQSIVESCIEVYSIKRKTPFSYCYQTSAVKAIHPIQWNNVWKPQKNVAFEFSCQKWLKLHMQNVDYSNVVLWLAML